MKKSTEELLTILKNTSNLDTYLSQESESVTHASLPDYLKDLCTRKNISRAQCIEHSGLNRTYGYQIFSGDKHPERNKLLALCFGFPLSFEETQSLLKATGYPILYAKDRRDSAIIFALQRNYTVIDTNELLFEMGMELLG